jgi:hypothetical protein
LQKVHVGANDRAVEAVRHLDTNQSYLRQDDRGHGWRHGMLLSYDFKFGACKIALVRVFTLVDQAPGTFVYVSK